MIYGNIHNLNEYCFLSENIKKCFDYIIKNNNLKDYKSGIFKIDGDNIFVNIVEYQTTTEDKRFWEAHRKYLDIHFMINEEEKINFNFINNLAQNGFDEEKDLLNISGREKFSIVLQEGDFLICYPNDAHMTALKVHESRNVKKAIFKVKI